MALEAVPPPPPLPAAETRGTPPPPPPRTGRIVLIVVVAVLVVVTGCSTLLYLGGSRLVGAARAPVDTANEFLDGARAGQGRGDGLACPGTSPVTGDLARSDAQDLSSVRVDGQGAVVSGTITLEDGQRSPITLELRRRDDGWCVATSRLAPLPGDTPEAPR